MAEIQASKPMAEGGKQYHLHCTPGQIAPYCLFVGASQRAKMIVDAIVDKHLGAAELVNTHRDLYSYTGSYKGMSLSVVTTQMGSPSTGIVMPEAVRCGARRIIRVGSCSALQPEMKLGEPIVVIGAVRLEGASKNWVMIEYPALADRHILRAFEDVEGACDTTVHYGIEATTDCFQEGQARPDDGKYVPQRLLDQHIELTARRVACYSMEAAAQFVWASTHSHLYSHGVWTGAVNAVYGNRKDESFVPQGDERAADLALNAMLRLHELYPIPLGE